MINQTKLNSFLDFSGQLLFVLFLFSVLFIPNLEIRHNLHIGAEEFFIPLMFLHWLFYRKSDAKNYIYLIGFIGIYILITILINFKTQSISDYFELYKIFKFGIIVLFATNVFASNKNLFHKTVCILLPALLFLNFLHYFDVFGFNQTIEPYYADFENHLQYFGLDSLGNPGSKRMLGTAGNPNVNALIFMFFFTYFLSKLDLKKINTAAWYVFMSAVGIVLCQSRTTMIGSVVILMAAFVFRRFTKKSLGFNFLIILMAVLVAYLISYASLEYYANIHIKLAENKTLRGRFEIWQYLLEMIYKKPIFGYGPSKMFFYENDLYSENEYILYTWRYGLIGLILYISWIIFPIFKNYKFSREHGFFLLMVIGILISAITNNPLSSPMTMPLFAIAAAHFYAGKSGKLMCNENSI
jgi:hypothetical protein